MEKFQFDRDFLAEDPGAAAEAQQRRATKSAKIKAAEAEGYAAGMQDAVAEAERRSASAMEDLAGAAHQILGTVTVELDQIRDDTTRLAAHIAKRFTAGLLSQHPEGHLEQIIASCLEIARREPSITIAVPAAMEEALVPKLNELLERHGLNAKVNIYAAPDLTGVACQIDWQTGGAMHTLEDTLEEISRAVDEHIAAVQMARNSQSTDEMGQVA